MTPGGLGGVLRRGLVVVDRSRQPNARGRLRELCLPHGRHIRIGKLGFALPPRLLSSRSDKV